MRKSTKTKRRIPGQTVNKGKQDAEAAAKPAGVGTNLHRDLVEFDREIPQTFEQVLQSLKEGDKTYGN